MDDTTGQSLHCSLFSRTKRGRGRPTLAKSVSPRIFRGTSFRSMALSSNKVASSERVVELFDCFASSITLNALLRM